MLRWWLALVLAVASAIAWAPSARAQRVADAGLAAATDRAQASVTAIRRYLDGLEADRARLRQQLNDELAAIDRLKRGPRGWRTKAQLEERLAEANETQKRLAAADARRDGARRQLDVAHAALAAAIDAELRAGASGSRAASLRAQRERITPRRAARRIVLPDTKADPRLDPEELDVQVAAIRQVEAELEAQIKGLGEREGELRRAHELRQQHARTIELDQREDNSSRRSSQAPAGGRVTSDSAAPPSPTEQAGGFEADAATVLPEVVDPSVLDGIRTAQRSGDLGKRADAVRATREAVARRLAELRAKRGAIEGLARQRR